MGSTRNAESKVREASRDEGCHPGLARGPRRDAHHPRPVRRLLRLPPLRRATPCARPSAAPPSSSTSRAPCTSRGSARSTRSSSVTRGLSLFGSFWYATAHYVVTAVVLVWLYRRGADVYVPARRALLVGTIIALVAYLLLPTAPPRLFGGYADVLALTSGDGWWGGDASAPKGLGGLTNQLAAFPSLHAGWALWVAMVLQRARPATAGCGSPAGLHAAHHRAGRRRHRQPLGRRRADRVAGDLARLRADLRRDRRPSSARRFSALRTTAGSVVVHIGGRLALRKPP